MGQLVRRLVNTLDADGEYQDEDKAPELSPHAVAAFAPAIILRRRTQQGLVEREAQTGAAHVDSATRTVFNRPTVAHYAVPNFQIHRNADIGAAV